MAEQASPRLNVVFIHGLFSSAETWARFRELLAQDEELSSRVSLYFFEYLSPKFALDPRRRIPDIDTVADGLGTFLQAQLDAAVPVLLVAHSQGGLIAQRYLVREIQRNGSKSLSQVRGLIMYATPNSGSEFFLSVRRTGFGRRHAQENELRPLAQSVAETLRAFAQRFVFSTASGPNEHPMSVIAYAGESDAIVPPASALSIFRRIGVLRGDHSTIIQPESHQDGRYRSLAQGIKEVLDGELPSAVDPVDGLPLAPPSPETVDAIRARAEIVKVLSRIKELRDELARRVILSAYLPDYIYDGVPSQVSTRTYLIALVQECERFGVPGKLALLATVKYGCPEEDPAVTSAVATIERLWGVCLPDDDGD